MSKIILVNDYLHGLMGERVLWDFMLEGIPNFIKVDIDVIKQDNIIQNIPNGMVYNQVNQIQLCELYNCADFFIIGSPSETQCLAAIESCLCDVPIIMRNTGFVTNLDTNKKNQIGIIGDNLEQAVYTIKNSDKKYIPKEIVKKYYSIDEMCDKWIKFLDTIC